tara:strand:- start:43 stop:306 length:264 start_codon:yes stop_codon:yes gene_type:complete
MTQNLGEINLRRRRRVGNPMHEFDQLPKPLRKWLSKTILPWSPLSVLRVWHKSISKGLSLQEVLCVLDKTEESTMKKEKSKIKNFKN